MQNLYLVKRNEMWPFFSPTYKSIQQSCGKNKEATRKPGECLGLDPAEHSDKCSSLSMCILPLEPMDNSTTYVWLFAAWVDEEGRNLTAGSRLQSRLGSWLGLTSGHRYSLIFINTKFPLSKLEDLGWQFTYNTVLSHWKTKIGCSEIEEVTWDGIYFH